jgi:hypothetical protein
MIYRTPAPSIESKKFVCISIMYVSIMSVGTPPPPPPVPDLTTVNSTEHQLPKSKRLQTLWDMIAIQNPKGFKSLGYNSKPCGTANRVGGTADVKSGIYSNLGDSF